MAEYFTTDHFKLLNKWKGQTRDDSNPEQNQAYEELCKAYAITAIWADKVQNILFPGGKASVRKRPTSQANKFVPYNWARIYPNKTAPAKLAYTIGIDADDGFVVKIDTVQADQPLRKKYEALREVDGNESPIVAVLPAADGLQMSLADLVKWSIDQINKFGYSYDEVAEKLGLLNEASDPESGNDNENVEPVSFSLEPAVNRIYYGPPGTGKTYAILRDLKENYTRQASSMSPEEWRMGQIASHIPELSWWQSMVAALYHLDREVDVAELAAHPFITAKGNGMVKRSTLWGILQTHASLESKTVMLASKHAPAVFDKTKDSQWHLFGNWREECDEIIAWVDSYKKGPKSAGESIKRYEFVTFHQSFGYEEFIEGLRPVLTSEGDDSAEQTGEVGYHIQKGAFLRLCNKARNDPANRYAMVIDEINRGNISKIFGELITLIEADKRSGCANEITVSLPYSGDLFSIPRNVDIIGSMNTADRSLALVDTALRRRFEFIAVMPDPATLTGITVKLGDGPSIDLQALLTVMNRRMEAFFDRDHTIGHAFFLPLKDLPEGERFIGLKDIFLKKIIPLLEEFFFDDWKKISLVLGDNQKTDKATHFIAANDPEQDLADLFGGSHDLAPEDLRPQRILNRQAFETPAAYIGIYKTLPNGGSSAP